MRFYRLRFCSNSLIYILSLSNSHNNVASIQKNRGDKPHRVIVALGYNYTVRFIAPILRYCANVKVIRYESTSLKRIEADKSHRVIVA